MSDLHDQKAPESNIRSIGFAGVSEALAEAAQTAAHSKFIFGSNILISGETGTGKTHLAKHLHEMPEKQIPVFHVDCARYDTNIDFFRKEVCGPTRRTPFPPLECGKFITAKATWRRIICLHRINLLHTGLQGVIKSFMNDACYPNSSANNAKIIATATQDFRRPYFDRKVVVESFINSFLYKIDLPPLRDRTDDIGPLIAHFAEEHFKKTGHRRVFSEQLIEHMTRYEWPGNARELSNVVHKLTVARCHDDELERLFLKEIANPEYFPGFARRMISPLRVVELRPQM